MGPDDGLFCARGNVRVARFGLGQITLEVGRQLGRRQLCIDWRHGTEAECYGEQRDDQRREGQGFFHRAVLMRIGIGWRLRAFCYSTVTAPIAHLWAW